MRGFSKKHKRLAVSQPIKKDFSVSSQVFRPLPVVDDDVDEHGDHHEEEGHGVLSKLEFLSIKMFVHEINFPNIIFFST